MRKIFFWFLIISSTNSTVAQVTVMTAGGNFTGIGGSTAYTIGQINYFTFTDSNQSLAEGVQQPFEVQVLSDSSFLSKNLMINAYPNPTSENIFLEISDISLLNCTYSLWDITGQELRKGVLNDMKTTISLENYAVGIYFLKVSKQNSSNKIFKIIKNK